MVQKKTEENNIERYTRWYFEELKSHGYIKEIIREPETIEVYPTHTELQVKRFKTKPSEYKEMALFNPIRYTYDFRILWDEKARYLFFDIIPVPGEPFIFGKPLFYAHQHQENGDIVSFVDTKPPSSVSTMFGKTNSSISFPIKQRIIFENTRIYINKFVPIPMAGAYKNSAVFIKSFTPARYLRTDKTMVPRKIAWKDKLTNIEGYVYKRSKELREELELSDNNLKLDF